MDTTEKDTTEKFLQLFRLDDSDCLQDFSKDIIRKNNIPLLNSLITETFSNINDLDTQIQNLKSVQLRKRHQMISLLSLTFPIVNLYFSFYGNPLIDNHSYAKIYLSNVCVPFDECSYSEETKRIAIPFSVVAIQHSSIRLRKTFSIEIYQDYIKKGFDLFQYLNFEEYVQAINSTHNTSFSWSDTSV